MRHLRDPWVFVEWFVLCILLPATTVFVLLSALISFWIGHAAYGVIFLVVFAVLALLWAYEHGRKGKQG